MSYTDHTLYLLCGKIASGKSTLAKKLGDGVGIVTLSEDTWLAGLYPDEIKTGADYVRYSARLKHVMGAHIVSLFGAGLSVVLDFPANTRDARAWMRQIIEDTGAAHEMHVLDTPDDICLARLHARNAQGDHAFAATEAQFQAFSRYFEAPGADEGFNIVRHEV